MDPRDGYPAGVPCWITAAQPDPRAAVEFYGALFGWEFEDRTPAGSQMPYFTATLGGLDVAAVGGQGPGEEGPATWTTYVWVESADAAAATAERAGGSVLAPPFEIADAGRMAVLADPDGAVFCVWQADTGKGAQLVNAPGTWNFSGLSTRNPERARAFYAAMFGWNGGEDPGFATWRLPGYGDHLAQDDPELRERMAAVGAPEGFEDVVAYYEPIADGDETPAHWSVTFAVDDADAIASRAAELGAEILVEPMDAPWVRTAVLRDPQGAVLTVSKFVPPDQQAS